VEEFGLRRPVVSIIMAVHNGGSQFKSVLKLLEDALALGCEVILVNDASTDETQTNISTAALLPNHGKCQILRVDYHSAGLSREAGIKIATGKYVWFCDADDRMMIDGVKKAIDKLIQIDADVVWANNLTMRDGLLRESKPKFKDVFQISDQRANGYYGVRDINRFKVLWNKFYRLDFIRSADIHFGHLRTAEDAMYNLDVFDRVSSTASIDSCIYQYNIGSKASLTHGKFTRDVVLREQKLLERIAVSFSPQASKVNDSFLWQEQILFFYMISRHLESEEYITAIGLSKIVNKYVIPRSWKFCYLAKQYIAEFKVIIHLLKRWKIGGK